MTIADWLYKNVKELEKASIGSTRLDCLLMLEHVTHKDRAWLLANGNHQLSKTQNAMLDELTKGRIGRQPIAYLIGTKEFYGFDFKVSQDTLIPRPESESFLELLKKCPPKKGQRLLDVGTGSGALAISAKLTCPELEVFGCDISDSALKLAKINSKNLGVNVSFFKSNLLSSNEFKFEYIFANLPYVPLGYKVSPEVHKEPEIAVFADNKGLDLIFRLATQLPNAIKPIGYVFIESLLEQQDEIISYYKKSGFKLIDKAGFVMVFKYIV